MPSIPEGYRKRLAEKEMDEALGSFGAVCISGPAGSGKAWAGLSRSESAFMLRGCNGCDTPNRELADMNVRAAMDGDPPHMIGEWQEVPKLWDSVRSEIDRFRAKGRFILTESYVPRDNAPVHSGTGRIRKIRMAPISLYESGESTGAVSLSALMRGEDIGIARREPDMGHLADLVLGGGWPAGLGRSHEERAASAREHLDSVVADACRMDGMHRKERTFRQVLRLLAENECAVISDARLQQDAAASGHPISYDTLRGYLDVLDRMFLIEDQPGFDPGLKSSVRVGSSAKRHLADPSLAAAAMGIGKERLMNDLGAFGRLFEALCERDLWIYARYIGGRLLHYRDANGMESDAIVEMEDGTWGAFEIKLGANKIDEAAENLLKFRRKMEKHGADRMPSVLCVICGLSEYAYRREDGVYVVPITMLGP